MQSNFRNSKEKLVWMATAGAAALVLVGSIAYSAISAANFSSQLEAIHKQEMQIQDSVESLEAIESTKSQCRIALSSAEDAYDGNFSAFMGWTDEFQVMLDYGIFAADTVALIAIPQLAADGDEALEAAKNATCE